VLDRGSLLAETLHLFLRVTACKPTLFLL